MTGIYSIDGDDESYTNYIKRGADQDRTDDLLTASHKYTGNEYNKQVNKNQDKRAWLLNLHHYKNFVAKVTRETILLEIWQELARIGKVIVRIAGGDQGLMGS